MKRILIVVDMQNDFVDGALGTPEAVKIVEPVAKRLRVRHQRYPRRELSGNQRGKTSSCGSLRKGNRRMGIE